MKLKKESRNIAYIASFDEKLKMHSIPKNIFQRYNNCVAEVTTPKVATLPENYAESPYKGVAIQENFDKF